MPDRPAGLSPRLRRAARWAAARVPAERRERLLDQVADHPEVIGRVLGRDDVAAHVATLDDGAMERLTAAVAQNLAERGGPDDDQAVDALIRAVAGRVPFELWERNGWHLTRNRPDSPIPDTQHLPEALWKQPAELPGIDLREAAQLALLDEATARFGPELAALPRQFERPGRFFLGNQAFGPVDAELAWALLRSHRPRRIVQAGGGWSTLLAEQALAANAAQDPGGADGRILLIEPWPWDFVRDAAAAGGRLELLEVPVWAAGTEPFAELAPGDVLWIDSSHVCRAGGDVQYELLELLPRLAPGVLVHFQGVWLPDEYPREWLTGPEPRFWNEQYVLQAFLAFNAGYEVVWASRWMRARHPELLAERLPSTASVATDPTSLWLRRTGQPTARDGAQGSR
jgi:Methyltransferase domain